MKGRVIKTLQKLRMSMSLTLSFSGRVEKEKNTNEINSYGYCFLIGLWYVETRIYTFFWPTEIFCRVELNLKINPILLFFQNYTFTFDSPKPCLKLSLT